MNTKHFTLIGCIFLATHITHSEDKSQSASSSQSFGNGFSGKVAETMTTAGYTYVLVDTGGKKAWAAAPQFEVKVGDSVVVADGMAMPNYHSKSLNRDFDVVYFTGSVTVNGAKLGGGGGGAGVASGQLPPNHPPIGGPGLKSKPAEKVDLTGIKRASGGQTVAEIYAKKSKLSGKPIKVRGKVVKYNSMIMGKNWLHVQDGTGDPGESDLMVNSASEVKVGDTVLVTGNLSINKDFGAGYRYDVIIEDAKVVVE